MDTKAVTVTSETYIYLLPTMYYKYALLIKKECGHTVALNGMEVVNMVSTWVAMDLTKMWVLRS